MDEGGGVASVLSLFLSYLCTRAQGGRARACSPPFCLNSSQVQSHVLKRVTAVKTWDSHRGLLLNPEGLRSHVPEKCPSAAPPEPKSQQKFERFPDHRLGGLPEQKARVQELFPCNRDCDSIPVVHTHYYRCRLWQSVFEKTESIGLINKWILYWSQTG